MGRGSKSGRGSNRGGGFRGGRGDGRGRGRGTPDSNRGRGGGKYISMNEIESEIQQYAEEPVYHTDGPKRGSYTPGSRGRGGGSGYPTPRGTNTPRGRGRGNSGRQTPNYNVSPSRGRGQPSFYGPQRGRGSKSRSGPNAPLSKLLYEDRPMLKPIVFVRSVHTATLFKEEEDILKAAVEKPEGEESHVPTADKVSQIFNEAAEENDEQLEEELEEIDFSEVGRIQAQVDTIAATLFSRPSGETAIVEERFTGFYIDPSPASVSHILSNSSHSTANILGIPEGDDEEIVYVAPHPRAGPVTPVKEKVEFKLLPTTSILTGLAPPMEPLLSPESSTVLVGESEDLTVVKSEVANTTTTFSEKVESMHGVTIDTALDLSMEVESSTTPTTLMTTTTTQESETVTIIPEASSSTLVEKTESAPVTAPAPSFESFSFTKLSSTPSKLERRVHPVNTTRSLLKKSKAARSARKLHHFGSYGAMLSEAHLREEANGKKKDPRRNEQRRGDSDVDWGDDTDGDEAVEGISNGLDGMELDGELDLKAMMRFVNSMGGEGSRHISMDDIADIERIRQEDQEGEGENGEDEDDEDDDDDESSEEDEEMEAVVRKEEQLLVAEGDDDFDSSSEDDHPSGSFQARLDRIRKTNKGKQRADVDVGGSEDDDDAMEMALDESWADQDNRFIAHIQSFVDEGQEILSRKDRNRVFNAIRNGSWGRDEYEELVARPAQTGKDKSVPPHLEAQWKKDREKKAENKRKRAAQRLELAADPLVPKKRGKKGMKASLAAARSSAELPNQVRDLVSLEQQIRRFLADLGGPHTMALPPANKGTRAKIHELANAFHLKSESKGKGDQRYTTLTKTTMSGININENKIRKILRSVDSSWQGPDRGGPNKVSSLAKHKEGEEVGKAAPKIGQSNIGFQMLAAMGWSEGDKIGLSGGLDIPLVAVMKKTKLGLGATVS